MLRIFGAVFILTASTSGSLAAPTAFEFDGKTELNRVDPGKVLDLINRIKSSGGGTQLHAQ